MKKLIFVTLGLGVLLIFTTVGAFGITIKLADRKVKTDDGLDDSIPVQNAFKDILAAGGGTIEFPSGVIDIKKQINILPEGYKPVNIIMKGDGGSVIRISVGSSNTAFNFGNLNQLKIENLIFTGLNVPADDPQFLDARFVVMAGWVSLVKIEETSFFGIAVPNGGAVVNVSSNLTIDNSQFKGNNAAYPDGAVVNLDCCTMVGQNANISNTIFLDYANFNGQFITKTPAFTGSWIRARSIGWTGDPSNQRITVSDSFFDEGAAWSIRASDIAAVNVRGSRFNVNASDIGAAIKLDGVRRMKIEDSQFGLSPMPRPFAVLSDTYVEMVGVTRTHNVQCPQFDPETTISWNLSDCE